MTDPEQEEFARRLRNIRPARPPENFSVRLASSKPKPKAELKTASGVSQVPNFLQLWRQWRRWLVAGPAVALALLLAWKGSMQLDTRKDVVADASRHDRGAVAPLLKLDEVSIDQKLVSSFDAVARLPSGEPVRFRCENWMDQVVMSDKSRGLVVENCKPRFEVAAVGFETY